MDPKGRGKEGRSGKKRIADKSACMKSGLGKQLANIDASALVPGPIAVSSDSGLEQVCSYNWAKTKKLSIYVPGAPPKWTAPAIPLTVPRDSGVHFIDLNAWKMPSCPFIPLFSSLLATNPSFSFADVDLLTNRNSLRKLLDFADNRVGQSFRIDASLVHDTLVLFRRERSLREFLSSKGGAQHASYGHNFEAAVTAPAPTLEASTSHHRTISYRLGALKCIVQFEVDAWYEDGEPSDETSGVTTTAEPVEMRGGEQIDDDPLGGIGRGLAGLSLGPAGCSGSSSAPQENRRASAALSVLKGDAYHQPPGRQLAEVKVRSRKPFQSSKAIPQMWFGRTPYLISGVHHEGVFDDVRVEHVGEKFFAWEDRNQESLRKLAALVTFLKELLTAQRQETTALGNGESGTSPIWALTCNHKVKPARLLVHELEKGAKTAAVPHEYVQAFWPRA